MGHMPPPWLVFGTCQMNTGMNDRAEIRLHGQRSPWLQGTLNSWQEALDVTELRAALGGASQGCSRSGVIRCSPCHLNPPGHCARTGPSRENRPAHCSARMLGKGRMWAVGPHRPGLVVQLCFFASWLALCKPPNPSEPGSPSLGKEI